MGKIGMLLRQGCLRLCPLMRTLYYNFLRGKTARSGRGLLLSTTYSVFDIHPTATLDVKGLAIYGFKKYRGSRLETSLWMDAGAEFALGSKQGGVSIYHGCDIQIFKGARFSMGGSCIMNRSAQVVCQEEIIIGDGCLISRDVVIRDNDGGHTVLVDGYKKSAPEIGRAHV